MQFCSRQGKTHSQTWTYHTKTWTPKRCIRRNSGKSEVESNCLKNSSLFNLKPVFDANQLLRVGRHIGKSDLCSKEQNPIIIPGQHHVTTPWHLHERVQHQSCQFTEGAIRSAGLWIVYEKVRLLQVCQVSQVRRKAPTATNGKSPSWSPKHRPTLHLCWRSLPFKGQGSLLEWVANQLYY